MPNDLISRDALLSKVKTAAIPEGSDYVTEHDVLFAPAVDAVQVVRCKDCCYWNRKYTTVGECEKLADRDQEGGAQFDCDMDNDDFCSYGKRKENT